MMGRNFLSAPAVADASLRKNHDYQNGISSTQHKRLVWKKLEKSVKTIIKSTCRCNCKRFVKFSGIKTRTALRKPQRRKKVS